MRRSSLLRLMALFAFALLLVPAAHIRAEDAEPAAAASVAAPATGTRGPLPEGVVFQPPAESEIDFGNDPPAPRREVEKDVRVVAVIFSVNQTKSMRKAFPDVENIDLMPIAGRPMIAHVVDGLRTSRFIDRIVVVADAAVRDALPFAEDPALTFLEDRGDAAENVKHGIHEIARGDLVVLLPSDLPLIAADSIDPLIAHARRYQNIDVFFPLIQREYCTDELTSQHRFIRFKEGYFTGAHVELVRPALFVDNASDVEGEKTRMYNVYNMRRDTLGIVRFLGLRLTVRYLVHNLSPADVATRLYTRYHVRAQAFTATDPRLAADVHGPDTLAYFEARLGTESDAASVARELVPPAPAG